MEQLKLQFLIQISEGTVVLTSDDRNLNVDDFPENSFTIDLDETDISSKYEEFIEEYFPDCHIPCPTFLIYPIINDEVLDIELSEDIEEDELHIYQIEDWLKSKEPLQWLRNYQLNKLGIQ
jgi:hypothetical protein